MLPTSSSTISRGYSADSSSSDRLASTSPCAIIASAMSRLGVSGLRCDVSIPPSVRSTLRGSFAAYVNPATRRSERTAAAVAYSARSRIDHAATMDLAAAESAACRRSPNCAAVSRASRSSSSPAAALSTSTSGASPSRVALRSRSFRVRAETRFLRQPPPSGISPTMRPRSCASRESGTTRALVEGRAKTRCLTRSASAAVMGPSASSTEPPPERVMLPLPSGGFEGPAADSPRESAKEEAAVPKLEGEMNGTAPSPSRTPSPSSSHREEGGKRPPPRAGGCRPRCRGSEGRACTARRGRARAPPAPLVTRRTPRTHPPCCPRWTARRPKRTCSHRRRRARPTRPRRRKIPTAPDTRRGRDAWRCVRRDARGARAVARRASRAG